MQTAFDRSFEYRDKVPNADNPAGRPRVRNEAKSRQQKLRDGVRPPARAGWIIIALFFGVLGGWSVIAPLNGAILASGYIKLETNRKSLQHHDGGIVKKIMVRDGDHVRQGQVLIGLDDAQIRAELEIVEQQYFESRAVQARLRAELDQKVAVAFPDDLISISSERVDIKSILSSQIRQFELRRTALDGQRQIVAEKIAQLDAQISGAEAQSESNRSQRESVVKEGESLAPLVDRGIVAKPRLLQLQRNAAAFDGQIGELSSAVARNRQAIAEQKQLAAQLDRDRQSDIAKELRSAEAKIAEIAPRLASIRQQLARLELRAPYGGRVMSLSVFSTGAVVAPGEKVLEIVPDDETLIVEAQVSVEDIADVHPGSQAEVKLIAYKQRTTPSVHGKIVRVSADRVTDTRNNSVYYLIQVLINENELRELPAVKLYPGMPAAVMIPTIERSAFDYIVGPLVSAFDNSFRQK